jgi:DNA-binding Lrp family transcriptional regulator
MKNIRTEILDILQDDAKVSAKEIASMLGEKEEAIAAEIKKLEEEKVILKYKTLINREKAEYDHSEGIIEVKVEPQRERGYDEIAKRIYRFDEVKAVYLMSGTYDLSVHVEASTMKQISEFVFEKLAVMDGIRSTATYFIMRKYKEHGVVFVEDEKDERLVISP